MFGEKTDQKFCKSNIFSVFEIQTNTKEWLIYHLVFIAKTAPQNFSIKNVEKIVKER